MAITLDELLAGLQEAGISDFDSANAALEDLAGAAYSGVANLPQLFSGSEPPPDVPDTNQFIQELIASQSPEVQMQRQAETANTALEEAVVRRDARKEGARSKLEELVKMGQPDSFSAIGNQVFRGDGSEMKEPLQGSYSKTKFTNPQDRVAASYEAEGVPRTVSRELANLEFADAAMTPAEARNLKKRGISDDLIQTIAAGRDKRSTRSLEALQMDRSKMANQNSAAQQDINLMLAGLKSRDPIAGALYVRAMLKRMGRPDEYIEALFSEFNKK